MFEEYAPLLLTVVKMSIKTGISLFLTFCCIITPTFSIIDHYCNMKNFKRIGEKKLRITYPKNHENFKNSKVKILLFLIKKECKFPENFSHTHLFAYFDDFFCFTCSNFFCQSNKLLPEIVTTVYFFLLE